MGKKTSAERKEKRKEIRQVLEYFVGSNNYHNETRKSAKLCLDALSALESLYAALVKPAYLKNLKAKGKVLGEHFERLLMDVSEDIGNLSAKEIELLMVEH